METISLYYGNIPKVTIDANMHPDKQINNLIQYLKFRRKNKDLSIYSNSIYVINFLTLLQGHAKHSIPHESGIDLTNIKVSHFEYIDKNNLIEGKYYEDMISDDNLLNNKIEDSNEAYSKMLELKQINNKICTKETKHNI